LTILCIIDAMELIIDEHRELRAWQYANKTKQRKSIFRQHWLSPIKYFTIPLHEITLIFFLWKYNPYQIYSRKFLVDTCDLNKYICSYLVDKYCDHKLPHMAIRLRRRYGGVGRRAKLCRLALWAQRHPRQTCVRWIHGIIDDTIIDMLNQRRVDSVVDGAVNVEPASGRWHRRHQTSRAWHPLDSTPQSL
jgi:hypothetical protein